MNILDYCCVECDEVLVQTSPSYLCCPNGHGRLLKAPRQYETVYKRILRIREFPGDTPAAAHIGGGWYIMGGSITKRYRIVRTKGGEKIDAKHPPEGCVVAILQDVPHAFREEVK